MRHDNTTPLAASISHTGNTCHRASSTHPLRHLSTRRCFPAPDIANLTYLLEQLQDVEKRFDTTTRDFNGNKVVRKPKRLHGTQAGTILLGEVAREGNWFASLHIGEPAQEVDMDLDMLTADWWILSTSSNKGSFYLDFHSKSYGQSPRLMHKQRLISKSRLQVPFVLPYLSRAKRCGPSPLNSEIHRHLVCTLPTVKTVDSSTPPIRSIPWTSPV
jgi:hypothetical protein